MSNIILNEIQRLDLDNPLEYCRKLVAPYAIEKLNNIISNCKECKTASYNHRLTYGNPDANLMIITDNATNDESVYEYLEQLLDQAQIDKEDIFLMSSISCINISGINNNCKVRMPSVLEVENCTMFVKHAIDVVKPRAILLMGASSLNMFRNACFYDEISNWIQIKDIPALITYSAQDMFYFMDSGLSEEEIQDKATVLLGDLVTIKDFIERS